MHNHNPYTEAAMPPNVVLIFAKAGLRRASRIKRGGAGLSDAARQRV